ncbi:hypothetical protein [Levilactobacillus sp. HBUAS70063]|uniref:hypothetical protein n=1 Tax=Levilactobacillus sp. HBUAS70063 TaxID=3109359 RepID=UPI003132DCCA
MTERLYSPKMLALMLFTDDQLKDSSSDIIHPISDSLPTRVGGTSAVRFQRDSFRKTINLIGLSFGHLLYFLNHDNLRIYFPHFVQLGYLIDDANRVRLKVKPVQLKRFKYTRIKRKRSSRVEQAQFIRIKRSQRVCLKKGKSVEPLLEGEYLDFYSYDKERVWTPLESILIVYLMNSMRNMSRGKNFDMAFRWNVDMLDGIYTEEFYSQKRSENIGRSQLKSQFRFWVESEKEFSRFDRWLIGHPFSKQKIPFYFVPLKPTITNAINNGVMTDKQILSLTKEKYSADALVREGIDNFAHALTVWEVKPRSSQEEMKWDPYSFDFEEGSKLRGKEMKWDPEDFDWEKNPWKGEKQVSWPQGASIDEWIGGTGAFIERDPYEVYHVLVQRLKKISKLKRKNVGSTDDLTLANKTLVNDGMYRWLTVMYYYRYILAEIFMPGIGSETYSWEGATDEFPGDINVDFFAMYSDYFDYLKRLHLDPVDLYGVDEQLEKEDAANIREYLKARRIKLAAERKLGDQHE